jgi:serine palmitoyltransferase
MRQLCHASVYAESMPPPVVQQIISSMASIMGPESLDVIPSLAQTLPMRLLDGSEGLERLRRLAFNARYISMGLRKLGFVVYGHRDSPIVPILIFNPGKLSLFSRMMLERYQIAVVVVAYPATPLISGRARFCVSAAHTKDDLDRVLRAADDIGSILGLKLAPRKHYSIDKVIAEGVKSVAQHAQ